METYDVFLLTSEWLDEEDGHKLVYYGRTEALGPVELVFDQHQPLFFVDREEKLPALDFEFERKPLNLKSLTGRHVDGFYFRNQRELKAAAERFRATGVRHFEADVRPDDRFLMERFIHARAVIQGEYTQVGRLARFENPKIKRGEGHVDLKVASIDIETGVSSGQLYSIAVHGTGRGSEEKIVFMLADRRTTMPENLEYYPSERELLLAFFDWFAELDPDIIIGWHVIGFDLTYIERKCADFGIPFQISRNGAKPFFQNKPGAGWFATIPGRVVLDGPPTMRGLGYRFENFKLETVAQAIIHTGKLITSDGTNKVAEIDRQFRHDKPALARYNLEDCVLVTDIYEKTKMIKQLVDRTLITGKLPDSVGIGNAAVDHCYLPKLHRKGYVAPCVEDVQAENLSTDAEALPGKPGVWDGVFQIDLGNLFPALLKNFCIDPLAAACKDEDPITTPGGHRFSKTQHIMPAWLDRLLKVRDVAEKSRDNTMVTAVDLMFKNVAKALTGKGSRFVNPVLAGASRDAAVWFLKAAKERLENLGHQVIFGDQDCLLVAVEAGTDPMEKGRRTATDLAEFARVKLRDEFRLDAEFHLSFAAFYPRLVLPGSARSWVGLKQDGHLVFEGMDRSGSSWTALAAEFQQKLYHTFFKEGEVDDMIRAELTALREGTYNDQLEYRKRLLKKPEEYGKNAPAHVKAARMLSNPGRDIRYVFTKRGPVPTAVDHADLDFEHYIQKQLQPVAEPLLCLLDKTFKDVSESEQLGLF